MNKVNNRGLKFSPAERQRLQKTNEKLHSQEPSFVYAQLGSPEPAEQLTFYTVKPQFCQKSAVIDSVKGLSKVLNRRATDSV